jgi:predicted transcriptional regulator
MENENIILKSQVARGMILYLNKREIDFSQHMSRELGFCWTGIVKTFKILIKEGIIKSVDYKEKSNYLFISMNKRNKYFKLTEKGKRIAILLMKLNQEVKK